MRILARATQKKAIQLLSIVFHSINYRKKNMWEKDYAGHRISATY